MFCLARGLIEEVTFREPREGITFGAGSDGKLTVSKTGDTLDVQKEFLRPAPPAGVADIAKLQARMTSVGSAEFATQVMHHPEEQSIKWVNQSA